METCYDGYNYTATFKLDPKNPPQTDWSQFDALIDEEKHTAALADPDAPPLTEAQLQLLCRYQVIRCEQCLIEHERVIGADRKAEGSILFLHALSE